MDNMIGYGYNNGFGYTENGQGNTFDMDRNMLSKLGFSVEEMNFLEQLYYYDGRVSVNKLVSIYGLNYEQARKIKYMYDICIGRKAIESVDDMAKHFRKMFGQHRRISLYDLESSSVGEVPRRAVVAGIPQDSPFNIWNSSNYDTLEKQYQVIDVTQSNIIIETNRIPVLKYKQDKFIDGILEIKEGPKDGLLKVAINKNYCRLCNRFVIAASLRKPEIHHGMYEILCIEGTRVYVFADTLASKTYSRFSGSTQRIYDFGYYPFEIEFKLGMKAKELANKLCGVHVTKVPANSLFRVIPQEIKKSDESEDIVIE